ncbi:MAG TPA: ABC transporter substrate-binding protein [Chthoniobacteraceae bacterium]|nr:ABC transporter substrate-binding protein [Chthoniobacteraceae bacterium]
MWRTFKDLSLGLGLIVAVSAALLYADRPRDQQRGVPLLAIMQFASSPMFDEVTQGIRDGLAETGFRDGETMAVQVFNAEGDIPTSNLIGKRVTDGSFDMVITASTICLQSAASANRDTKVPHVFCAVTDPTVSGVGITALDSLDKPKHLTGIGTMQPVEPLFRYAKRIRPGLKKVGVVWNPSEANSVACTARAREVCKELGITLLEASIEATTEVRDAALGLVSRGAEAFWVGSDVTVLNAYDSVGSVARQARVPILSNLGGHVKRGALIDLGGNYYQVGRKAGEIAGTILSGKATAAEIAVINYVPGDLNLNPETAKAVKWSFPPDVVAEGKIFTPEPSRPPQASPASPTPTR